MEALQDGVAGADKDDPCRPEMETDPEAELRVTGAAMTEEEVVPPPYEEVPPGSLRMSSNASLPERKLAVSQHSMEVSKDA